MNAFKKYIYTVLKRTLSNTKVFSNNLSVPITEGLFKERTDAKVPLPDSLRRLSIHYKNNLVTALATGLVDPNNKNNTFVPAKSIRSVKPFVPL